MEGQAIIGLKYDVYCFVCLLDGAISWRSVLLVEETGATGENCHKSLTNFIT